MDISEKSRTFAASLFFIDLKLISGWGGYVVITWPLFYVVKHILVLKNCKKSKKCKKNEKKCKKIWWYQKKVVTLQRLKKIEDTKPN